MVASIPGRGSWVIEVGVIPPRTAFLSELISYFLLIRGEFEERIAGRLPCSFLAAPSRATHVAALTERVPMGSVTDLAVLGSPEIRFSNFFSQEFLMFRIHLGGPRWIRTSGGLSGYHSYLYRLVCRSQLHTRNWLDDQGLVKRRNSFGGPGEMEELSPTASGNFDCSTRRHQRPDHHVPETWLTTGLRHQNIGRH